jgi:hypothetical protein
VAHSTAQCVSSVGLPAGPLGPDAIHFLLVAVAAPELDELAVLDAQHQHCPFTVERLVPDVAGQFY